MKRKLRMIIISLFLVTASLIIQFARNYPTACDTYAELGIKGTVTFEINKTLAENLNNKKHNYNEMAIINNHTDGSISSITVETSKVNVIALELSGEIYNAIISTNTTFGIPLGNAMGSKMLSGSGPMINIKIIPVGTAQYDIKSELLSSGINQTLHRISISFSTEIICLAPFHEYRSYIETEIVLAETLIMGKIPEIVLHR